MGAQVRFTVVGSRPPIKDGGNSMWGKPEEQERIEDLRKQAFQERNRQGLTYFTSRVKLSLAVSAPDIERVGDLDNFLSGVCDAIQPADKKVWPSIPDKYKVPPIDFTQPMLVDNDKKIIEIIGIKKVGPLSYTVTVEEI